MWSGLGLRRLALLAAATLSLVACGGGGGGSTAASPMTSASGLSPLDARILNNQKVTVDTSKYKKSPPYTVGLIVQGPFNGWGLMYDLTAKYTLNSSGKVKSILYADSQGDPTKEISDMQNFIVQKPDAIILTPLSKAALTAPVERAMNAGIPVVLCGSGVTGDNYVTEGGRNLYEIAYSAADKLAQRMNGQGNVMMFNGIAGSDTAITWHDAAMQAFQKYPGVKVVADQYANWSIADSKTKAAAILAANSKIDGVFTGGSEMSIGTIQAFADAGRPMPLFGTTNPLNGFLRLAKQYNLKFVADPYPPELSQTCANLALDVLAGKPVKKYVDMSSTGVSGVSEYTETDIDRFYKPAYNDDFIAPAVIPADQLTPFARK